MTTSIKPILSVGLNPAFQKVYNFQDFSIDSVNRVKTISELASGKGINVARVLHTIGVPVIVSGFVGGFTGEFIIEDLERLNLAYQFIKTKNKTRTCTTLLAAGKSSSTELVEEGQEVFEYEIQEYIDQYNLLLKKCSMVVISGTAPAGVPDDIYFHLITRANNLNVPVLVDAQKAYLQHAMRSQPFLVKPNLNELRIVMNKELLDDESIWESIDEILKTGIECIVISNEENATYLAFGSRRIKIVPPQVEPVNAIGSGDAFAAGIASVLVVKRDFLEAVIYGTACATASTLTSVPGEVDPGQIVPLMKQVKVIPQ